MSVQRIIPVLLHLNGRLVLSRDFKTHNNIGTVEHITDRLKAWDLDELIVLDITPSKNKDDHQLNFEKFLMAVDQISKDCFVPLSVGGGIKTLDHVSRLMHSGADRVVINSHAYETPKLLRDISRLYGAQAVIAAIDAKRSNDGLNEYDLYSQGGKRKEDVKLEEWLNILKTMEVGEIFIQSIDRDGCARGYDTELTQHVIGNTDLPVIACGGAGTAQDIFDILKSGVKGAAAANIFNFTEVSYQKIKDFRAAQHPIVRPSKLNDNYQTDEETAQQEQKVFYSDDHVIWQKLKKTGFME